MSRKQIKFSLVALILILVTGLKAQDMNVLEKAGNTTKIALHTIRSINFNSGNLNINLKQGTPLSVSLTNVRNLNFFLITNLDTPIQQSSKLLLLYPNPAKDQISVVLPQENNTPACIKIISIDGRIIYSETISASQDATHKIDISTWQKGIYGVFVNSGNAVLSGKLLKN